MADVVPAEVRSGTAALVGQHNGSDKLTVLFMMPFKDQAGLEAFIADVSNPSSPNYGHYLTLDEENARFNPDVANEQRVSAWLQGSGISGLQTVPNHLYVYAQASAASIGKLLNVQINDYTLAGNSFYAPDRTPILPASVSGDVTWIAGLSNQDKIQTDHSTISKGPAGSLPSAPLDSPPYAPKSYATAYDANTLLNGGYSGTGTHIAITLWLIPPSDATLNGWSSTTGNPVATRANTRLGVILTDGSNGLADDGEAGLDIESTSGIATQAHIRYYEASQAQFSNLAHALNVAGTDSSNNRFISNSWGAPESTSAHNSLESVLVANTATGHDYVFSSGDNGSWANGSDPYPNYPAGSAYVTSIGGTRFNADINGSWPGEQSWLYDPTGNQGNPEGSGGGFSHLSAKPSWQNAPGFPSGQTKRGYPDISAVGDPATGSYVCIDGGCGQIGGTSLAAPLWAAMLDITDQYVAAHGRPHLGFPKSGPIYAGSRGAAARTLP